MQKHAPDVEKNLFGPQSFLSQAWVPVFFLLQKQLLRK